MMESPEHAPILRLAAGAKRVLDVGCSDPGLTEALAGSGHSVWGIAPAGSSTPTSTQREGVRVVTGDPTLQRIPPSLSRRRFDAVILSSALETVAEPDTLLARVPRLLAPTGWIIVSATNAAQAGLRVASLVGAGPSASWAPDHPARFTAPTLRALLEGAGYAIHVFERILFVPEEIEVPEAVRLPPSIVEWILQQPESLTRTFVVRASARASAARPSLPAPPVHRIDLGRVARRAAELREALKSLDEKETGFAGLTLSERERILATIIPGLAAARAEAHAAAETSLSGIKHIEGPLADAQEMLKRIRRARRIRRSIAPAGTRRGRVADAMLRSVRSVR